MRLQKIVIISTLVGLNFNSAFSQTERKSSEEFFRENSARSATDDKLAEILRQKQAELDAKERNTTGAKSPSQPIPATPAPVAAPKPLKAVVTPPPVTAASQDQLEDILRKKQAELDAKENSVPQVRAVVPPSAAAPTRPVVTEPKPATVTVAQPVVDPAAEARLVEALRKKQAELDAKEGIVTPRPAPATAVTKEQQESDKRVQQIEAEIKAKEEANKRSAATQSKPTPEVQADTSAQRAAAVNAANQTAKSKGSKKQAVPAPVFDPITKEGRLAELLRRYKADEITPHDYHMERAKIIAEP